MMEREEEQENIVIKMSLQIRTLQLLSLTSRANSMDSVKFASDTKRNSPA